MEMNKKPWPITTANVWSTSQKQLLMDTILRYYDISNEFRLSKDHIIAWLKGRNATVLNDQVACSICNSSKSNN